MQPLSAWAEAWGGARPAVKRGAKTPGAASRRAP
jgi:hypothetical protein